MKARTSIGLLVLLLAFAAGGLWFAVGDSGDPQDAAAARAAAATTRSSSPLDLASDAVASDRAERTVVAAPATQSTADAAANASTANPGTPTDGSLSGRLFLPDGAPAANVAVGLFPESRKANRTRLAETRTAVDGSYSLRATPGAVLVVAVAGGLPPLSLSAGAVAGTDTRLEDATFSVGAHIRGRWRVLGRPVAVGSELTAVLSGSGSGKRLALDGRILLEAGGNVVEPVHEAATDAAGRFAMEGLEPGAYRVTLRPKGDVGRFIQPFREVRAPIDDWNLDFEEARLLLYFESEGRPVAADLRLTEPGARGAAVWTAGATSTLDVLVTPSTPYGVDVESEGCLGTSLDVTSPGPRETLEQTVTLECEKDLGEIVIDLATEDGTPIRRAGIALFREDQPARGSRVRVARRVREDGRPPDIVRNRDAQDGTYVLGRLPAGRYDVRIEVEGTWDEGASPWRHDELVVDLAPNGRERRRVVVHGGGRLRVRAVDRSGVPVAARCVFTDPNGVEIAASFRTRSATGTWLSRGYLDAAAPGGWGSTSDALAPGRYEVRLMPEGFRDESRSAVVESGRTTDVEFVLGEP